MTAHSAAVVQAAILELALRAAAVIAVCHGVAALSPTFSARQRRRLWLLVFGMLGGLVVVAVARLWLQLGQGAPAQVEAIVLPGGQALTFSVPARATEAPGWAGALVGIIATGTAVALARLLHAQWRARTVARKAEPETDPALNVALTVAASRVGVRRLPRLLRSPAVATAALYGLRNPVILVGVAARDWRPKEQEQVLAHELIHLTSCDAPASALSRIIGALFWWHPLAASAVHRLHLEMEFACDEWIVLNGTAPADYAETLLEVALRSRPAGPPRVSYALGADGASLSARVVAVLRYAERSESSASLPILPLTVAAMLVFALWPGIATAPPHNRAYRIEASAVPQDRDGKTRVRVDLSDNDRLHVTPRSALNPASR